MNTYVVKTEPGFDVIGIAARTSNEAEMQGRGVIPQLWQQFFADQVLAKIPHKADPAILELYYDFASDKDGEYTVLIGVRVTSTNAVPTGMVSLHVPAGKTAIFITEKGPVPQVVVDTWQKIWTLEDQGKLKHTYTVDYEVYDERSQDTANAQVEIHVSTN